jgi:hypothetical protein
VNKIKLPDLEVVKLLNLIGYTGNTPWFPDNGPIQFYTIEIELLTDEINDPFKIYMASVIDINDVKRLDICFTSLFKNIEMRFYFDPHVVSQNVEAAILKHFKQIILYYENKYDLWTL